MAFEETERRLFPRDAPITPVFATTSLERGTLRVNNAYVARRVAVILSGRSTCYIDYQYW